MDTSDNIANDVGGYLVFRLNGKCYGYKFWVPCSTKVSNFSVAPRKLNLSCLTAFEDFRALKKHLLNYSMTRNWTLSLQFTLSVFYRAVNLLEAKEIAVYSLCGRRSLQFCYYRVCASRQTTTWTRKGNEFNPFVTGT